MANNKRKTPPKLDFGEIMQRLDFYKSDPGLIALQERARNSWNPLFTMTRQAPVPDQLTRGLVMNMSSPRLKDLTDAILSVFDSYKVIATVAAHGEDGEEPSAALKKQADKNERGATLVRSKYNDGGRLRREHFWNCLNTAYSVVVTKLLPDGTVQAETPDIFSCYFPVQRPPYRAPVMIQDYEILISEAEELYGDSPYNVRRGRKPVYGADEPKQWGWKPIGDDVAHESDQATNPLGGDRKYGERVRVIRYTDEYYTYHALCNSTDQNDKASGGEIVYCERNLGKGTPAFVLSGSATPLRDAAERMGPALLPVYQVVFNRNLIRTIRMVKSVNVRPDAFIEMSPELFEDAASAGVIVPVGAQAAAAAASVELEANGDANLISVNGTVKPWIVAPDDDLDKLDLGWEKEEAEYINAWREPTDPATVADARVNTYLTAVEAIRLRQVMLLRDADWLDRQILTDWFESIRQRHFHVTLTADGGELTKSGELSAGTGITITPKDVALDQTVSVTTKSQTDSERRARTDSAIADADRGVGTLEEAIEIKYLDASAQIKRQAIDAGYRLQRPLMLQHADMAWRGRVLQSRGILLPGGAMAPAPAPGAPGQGGPAPMQPAAINGAIGGDGSTSAAA